MLILSCLPEGVGMGISRVVHLVDSDVPQVLVGFGAGGWRMLENQPQGWPLALGLVGAWQAEAVWKSPGAMRKSPAAESPQGAAGLLEPPVRWSVPAGSRDLTSRGWSPGLLREDKPRLPCLGSVPTRWCGANRL